MGSNPAAGLTNIRGTLYGTTFERGHLLQRHGVCRSPVRIGYSDAISRGGTLVDALAKLDPPRRPHFRHR